MSISIKNKHAVVLLTLTITGVLSLAPAVSSAQGSRQELEDRRKQLLEDIKVNNDRLETIQKDKATKLNRYYTLRSQIQKRRQLVSTLQQELTYADEAILRVDEVIQALGNDIDRLKTEYAQMLRIAYRHRLNGSFLSFLFSARSFNDAFRRWQYLRQYDRYRKRQAQVILETQDELTGRSQELEAEKLEKQQLLVSAEEQQRLLAGEMGMMDELITTLKENESKVTAELKQQQDDHQQLNDLIEKVIFTEMARKREEARSSEALAQPREDKPAATTVAAAVPVVDAASFVKNKGRLPWPVQNGVITRYFGTQAHPTIKSVEITNNGIDISTDSGSEVRAIYNGEVVGIQYVPGYKNTLILQHGPYYTVYSNLDEAIVARGEVVAAGQTLGRMGSSDTELHFEVWREKQKLNPVHWIQQR